MHSAADFNRRYIHYLYPTHQQPEDFFTDEDNLFQIMVGTALAIGQSSTIEDQSAIGTAICDRPNSFPADYPEGVNNYASMDVITVSLDADKTHSLLHEISGTYNTRINDVLLSSLLLAAVDGTNLDGFVSI